MQITISYKLRPITVAFRRRTTGDTIHYYGVSSEDVYQQNETDKEPRLKKIPVFLFSDRRKINEWKGPVTVIPVSDDDPTAHAIFREFADKLEDAEKQLPAQDDLSEDLYLPEDQLLAALDQSEE